VNHIANAIAAKFIEDAPVRDPELGEVHRLILRTDDPAKIHAALAREEWAHMRMGKPVDKDSDAAGPRGG